MSIEIIYKDDYLVAINKPHGLLVHRSSIAADVHEFALQKVRDLVGQKVYLVHRIDRKTSGVLVFALDPSINRILNNSFRDKKVIKTYLAIVRGWVSEDFGTIDYALTNDRGKIQEAVTHFKCLERVELSVKFGLHNTSRYSVLEAYPETGRLHQIRKHFSHIRHPIIGDRPHGCNKQNRLWKDRWQMTSMMLHAKELKFDHPTNMKPIHLKATLSAEMSRVFKLLTALAI